MSVDLLSEMLAPLRLRGVFHSRWTARAPWGVAGERESCALLHYVRDGRCVVELPDAEPVRLGPGELAVFPQGAAHRLADAPGRATVPLESVLPGREPGSARTVSIDGPGEPTVMLCGGLHYDADAAAPLYRALPQVLVLDRAAVAGEPLLGDLLSRLAAAG
ncbi:cupin domain-containing protein, partial [Nonomuraea antimicrobica]|uniref:cupin domain-containing protein n=1 Tax=Nonomuraea antimicrobica TaxID=561173 RepID=UPI0031ED5966